MMFDNIKLNKKDDIIDEKVEKPIYKVGDRVKIS